MQHEPLTIVKSWKGSFGTTATQKFVVVHDAAAWREVWKETDAGRRIPTPPPPEIDFSTHFVVAAFMGQKRSGGFAITITGVRREGEALVVPYREMAPPKGSFVTMALTAPYHVVEISRSAPSGFTVTEGTAVRYERQE